MKNYARKTNRNVTRYRTPATFRVRAVMINQKSRLDNNRFGKNDPSHRQNDSKLITGNQ
jgi:hypothetical protein